MITEASAETLARELIQKYLNECKLDTIEDAGNALMKLCSVTGVAMCATVGHQEAVSRLHATAAYIERTMSNEIWTFDRAN